MTNISKIFFNFILIILFTFSLLKFYSENASGFSEQISNSIEQEFLEKYNTTTKIDTIKIKWKGINPYIKIKNLKLKNKKNNIILETPASTLKIDLLKSLFGQEIYINEIVVNNTSINLMQDNSKIFFNDLNLIPETNMKYNSSIPKIVLRNSKIKLNNKNTKSVVNFTINTFVVNNDNNNLTIKSNFLHESSPEPISFLYQEINEGDNKISKAFVSANSIKLPYELIPASFQLIKSDRISFRVWVDMNNMITKKIIGNISTSNLDVKLPHVTLKMKDVNSDIIYIKNKKSDILSFLRLNYQLNDTKVNNNKIVISKNKSKEVKLYIKKNSHHIVKALSKKQKLIQDGFLTKLESGDIKNLQIHTTNKNIIKYYNFSINHTSFQLRDSHYAEDISFDVHGNLKKGRININSLSLSNNNNNYIKKIKGAISYNIRGKSIYFSSSDLIDENGQTVTISGKKVSKYPSLKISISNHIKDVADFIYPKREEGIIQIDGKLNTNIYYYQNKIFSKIQINNFYLNKSDLLYLTSENVNLYYTSNMINSNKFKININNQTHLSKITTNANSESYNYIMTSLGEIEANLLLKLFTIDNNFIKGKSLVKSNFVFNKNSNKLSMYASSDLEGISIKLGESLLKKQDEKLNISVNYEHSLSVAYPISISVSEHNFKIKNQRDYLYLHINSPAARGFLKYPKLSQHNEAFNGSFEYIDTSFFAGQFSVNALPRIDIKSKHLKSNDVVFDNFHIILTPKDKYTEITKLNFKNPHLEMMSTGKWHTGDKEATELSATIQSDNFGLALKTLGYSDVIKGGKIKAKLNGNWTGTIQNFTFSRTKGSLSFDITEGQINELDKGTQAIGQVLGLFSISSIPKRLSLDFSDFFSTGLSFDELSANVSLDSGMADTKKMTIVGSFGEMRLSGKSDLVKQTHDQVLIFIPDLSSTSLVTGAVLGGPIGAAASIFYDKLLKELGVDTNKLAGIEYSIKGPWADPQIKVTQSFKPILN